MRDVFQHRKSPVLLLAVVLLAGCANASSDEQAKKSSNGSENTDVVASFGGEVITLDQVDERAKKTSVKPYQDLYNARRNALQMIIADRLLELEAQSRGLTPEEVMDQEVQQKVPEVTDEAVTAFYEQNKSQMNGQELNDDLKTRIRNYLRAQSLGQAQAAFLERLKSKASVKISLEPPRVDVAIAANDPVLGPATAPVTIIEFSDFQCPYCGRVASTVNQLAETYGDKVRIVYRDYPLPMHKQAPAAAEAAQCANEQGKFWPYHDKLFANQRALSPEDLKKYAADLGLDTKEFDTCFDNGKYRQDISQDFQEGQQAGVTGTPSFFINGRFLSGAQSLDAFKEIIDEELAAKGTSAG